MEYTCEKNSYTPQLNKKKYFSPTWPHNDIQYLKELFRSDDWLWYLNWHQIDNWPLNIILFHISIQNNKKFAHLSTAASYWYRKINIPSYKYNRSLVKNAYYLFCKQIRTVTLVYKGNAALALSYNTPPITLKSFKFEQFQKNWSSKVMKIKNLTKWSTFRSVSRFVE